MRKKETEEKRLIGDRRLTAIMFTDAVGYSARMQSHEALVIRLIKRDFEVIEKLAAQNDGEVLKTTGDGLLLAFPTASAAVKCALQVQKIMANAAKSLPPEQVIEHRIGIHLGDVFIGDADAMGNDVNIAARILQEAGGGEICVSQTVYDVVKHRLAVKGIFLGSKDVKNIHEPIPIFRLPFDDQATRRRQGNWCARTIIGLGIAATIMLVCAGWWLFHRNSSPSINTQDKTASLMPKATAPISVGPVSAMTSPAQMLAPVASVRERGLVLHFSFNDPAVNGVVKDESGSGNDGRVIGAKWIKIADHQGAYLFNAASRTDAIVVPNSDALNVDKITESAWIKTKLADQWWRRIIDKDWETGYDLTMGGKTLSGASFVGMVGMESGNHFLFSDHLRDHSVADGRWHHVAATYDGVEMKLYIDGRELQHKLWHGKIGTNSSILRIGNGDGDNSRPGETPETLAFDGEISDVRIYNRALSHEEILALKNPENLETLKPADRLSGLVLYYQFPTRVPDGQRIPDLSGCGNDGIVDGAKWVNDPDRGGVYYLTLNKLITVKNSPSINPKYITLSAWIKTLADDGQWHMIFHKASADNYGVSIGGDWHNSHRWRGKLYFEIGPQPIHFGASQVVVNDGKWHHLVTTYDGNDLAFFVDGTPSGKSIPWPGTLHPNDVDLTLGLKSAGKDPHAASLDGLIDEPMIFNRALSPAEVADLFQFQSGNATTH